MLPIHTTPKVLCEIEFIFGELNYDQSKKTEITTGPTINSKFIAKQLIFQNSCYQCQQSLKNK